MAIFERLPPELQLRVLELCEQDDLARVCRTSQSMQHKGVRVLIVKSISA